MSSSVFRDKVKAYLRTAGITQKQLARELGLNTTVLSHKLNATDNMRVTEAETLRVVKLLAQWQAISRRTEAEELLVLMGMEPSAFTADEWTSAPLVSLEIVLTTAATEPSAPSTLPTPLNRLIGRDVLLDAITALLAEDDTRLITLTGSGGVGKTRLAVEIGREAQAQFKDGVAFVGLASLCDSQLVASEIAHQLQIRPDAQTPVIESVKRHVATLDLLLILDNFEHVVDAAPLVTELLDNAPNLKIVITSRVRLNLPFERQVEVPPLELPDAQRSLAALSEQPAVALFVARSQTVRNDFQLTQANAQAVADICVRLDGLPLALELAAARIRLFSPQSLLARLNEPLALLSNPAANVAPRQRTLSETIAWSYRLLEPDEQRLFLVISLFPGTCTLEALQAVLDGDADQALNVAEGVASLLDKSLIQQRDGSDQRTRYTMLQTVRDYGVEQVAAHDLLGTLRQRQTDYYVALVKSTAPKLTGATRIATLDMLEAENDNLRAMLRWTIDRGLHARVILAANLCQFWSQRGYTSEGQGWIAEVLSRDWQETDSPTEQLDYGLAFNGAGVLAFIAGNYAQAKDYFEKAVTLRRTLNDLEGLSSTYNNLGNLAWNMSDLASAKSYFETAVEISEELHKHALTASVLNNLGSLLQGQGELDEAERALTRALAIWRELGNQQSIGNALSNLGMIAFDRGQFEQALAYYSESLPLQLAAGNQRNAAAVMSNLAELALQQGNLDEAQRGFEETLRLQTEVNYQWGMGSATCDLGRVAFFRGEYGTALARLNEALAVLRPLEDTAKISYALEALGMTIYRMGDKKNALVSLREALALRAKQDDVNDTASTLACMAAVYAADGDPLRAAVLWGSAFGLWQKIKRTPPPTQRKLFEQEMRTARINTDPDDFDHAWNTGAEVKLRLLTAKA
ncbi:MAG: tetratricopeptide repeat protein [Anaerolineae bacterium]|nr:tetratricopeptide repeat protein [Anaerolineae bacterium]